MACAVVYIIASLRGKIKISRRFGRENGCGIEENLAGGHDDENMTLQSMSVGTVAAVMEEAVEVRRSTTDKF